MNLVLAAALLPQAAAAQAPVEGAPQEVREMIDEIEALEQAIQDRQEAALDHPEIADRFAELEAAVEKAMVEIDPSAAAFDGQLKVIELRTADALAAGDDGALGGLAVQAQSVQRRIIAAQTRAMESPEIAALIEDFYEELYDHMVRCDPVAVDLFRRYEIVQIRLSDITGMPEW